MASHRPYRAVLGTEAAFAKLKKNKDILYDPEVVDICLKLSRKNGLKFN
jgi:response regulator RpfG family c-di-GMP phosphodiesterase